MAGTFKCDTCGRYVEVEHNAPGGVTCHGLAAGDHDPKRMRRVD